MSHDDQHNHNESGFYKGLFYGVLVGLGLVWFFGTKEGKKMKEELLAKGEDFISQTGQKLETLSPEDEV